ncbi:hypothetical protein XENOCAPTIV_027141 [Xenoophorus captivus]|uniref:C2H2-type domain-containing protein n=1 Tax=Xenoophorus captivus TaxID=1517983 RepID=A0ABV0Q6C3_9TELE
MDCGAVELSDSSSSGYWSVNRGPRSPAPPSSAAETNGRSATPPDEDLDMDLDQVLFEEPAPRKRRNSLKVAYQCLWPSCGKVLTSLMGIKRHIRMVHLSAQKLTLLTSLGTGVPGAISQCGRAVAAASERPLQVSVSVWYCRLRAPQGTCSLLTAVCLLVRRIRSEAKKCRKVYGIEHRELWCTPCRWKKACQRFLD